MIVELSQTQNLGEQQRTLTFLEVGHIAAAGWAVNMFGGEFARDRADDALHLEYLRGGSPNDKITEDRRRYQFEEAILRVEDVAQDLEVAFTKVWRRGYPLGDVLFRGEDVGLIVGSVKTAAETPEPVDIAETDKGRYDDAKGLWRVTYDFAQRSQNIEALLGSCALL